MIDVYVVTMQLGSSNPHNWMVEPSLEDALITAMDWAVGIVTEDISDEDVWERRQGNQHRPTKWRYSVSRMETGSDPVNFYVRRFNVNTYE